MSLYPNEDIRYKLYANRGSQNGTYSKGKENEPAGVRDSSTVRDED